MANREVLNSGDESTVVSVFNKNTENGLMYHFSFVFLWSRLTSYRRKGTYFPYSPNKYLATKMPDLLSCCAKKYMKTHKITYNYAFLYFFFYLLTLRKNTREEDSFS